MRSFITGNLQHILQSNAFRQADKSTRQALEDEIVSIMALVSVYEVLEGHPSHTDMRCKVHGKGFQLLVLRRGFTTIKLRLFNEYITRRAMSTAHMFHAKCLPDYK